MIFSRLLVPALLALVQMSLAAEPIKVACVGDSITEGTGLSNPGTESYPARLQRLMGTNYVVRNYGVSGRTLLKKGDYPYWKESAYTQSHTWNPDVVVIQLGTNDAKPYNWKYGTNFVEDYEALIASYRELTSSPAVFLCAPCPVYGNGAFDIKPGTVATNVAPAVRELASRLGFPLIDLNERLAGHPEWFPDTVHPNSKGMAAMAAVMFDALSGEPPAASDPEVGLTLVSPSRLLLEWPARWGGMVVQTCTGLRSSNTVWTVVETLPFSDGTQLRQTNLLSGFVRLYRLVRP